MSGFEIVGLLLGLYPIVIQAVNVYKATKSGRAAASMFRKLKTEEVIYRQFVQKLLAPNIQDDDPYQLYLNQVPSNLDPWKSVTLNQRLRLRLGSDTADLILQILQDIDVLLKDLNSELQSIGRGMEVLEKFRMNLRVAKYSKPLSSFQQRLGELTTLNADLNRLLDENHHASRLPKNELKVPQFLVRDYQEAIELYDFVRREGYDCECDNPHVTNFGLHCPAHSALFALPDFKSHEWEFELVLPPSGHRQLTLSDSSILEESGPASLDDRSDQSLLQNTASRQDPSNKNPERKLTRQRSRSISISVLKSRQLNEENSNAFFQDICSFVRSMSTNDLASDELLGIIGKTNRRYKLSIKPEKGGVSMDIIKLEEFLKPSSPLPRKDRMQLALWLSCSILQFYYTGWIDNAWTSKDFSVLSVKEEQHDDLSQLIRLFVTRSFYSARLSTSEPVIETVNNLWSWYDEPILTNLGFALIELAFCRTLSEIRKDQLHNTVDEKDLDFSNLQTATAMLDSGRLAREESQVYEDVVRVCIRHQYLGDSSSGPKGLDSKDPSFFERAEESIIGPLSAEFAKSWGLR